MRDTKGTRTQRKPCLLILPAAVGTVLISIPIGLITSSVFTVVLLLWPSMFAGMEEGLKSAITCFAIDDAMAEGTVVDVSPYWKTVGLI